MFVQKVMGAAILYAQIDVYRDASVYIIIHGYFVIQFHIPKTLFILTRLGICL
jgi:hypothetical protein